LAQKSAKIQSIYKFSALTFVLIFFSVMVTLYQCVSSPGKFYDFKSEEHSLFPRSK